MATSMILLWIVQLLMRDMACITSDSDSQYYNVSVTQSATKIISATVGDNISLPCFVHTLGFDDRIIWYKQSLGMPPIFIIFFNKYDTQGKYLEKSVDSQHLKHDYVNRTSELYIRKVEMSDSGIYNCIHFNVEQINVLTSITLMVKDLLSDPINRTVFETTQNGSSETLRCIVNTWSCGEKPIVNWLEQSEESAIGGGNGKMDTYNCTVDICGQVLTGNATKLSVKDGVAVYVWSGALVFFFILVLGMAFSLYILKKKYNSLRAELERARASMSAGLKDEDQEADNHYYAAVRHSLPSKQRKTVSDDGVYSTVQLH